MRKSNNNEERRTRKRSIVNAKAKLGNEYRSLRPLLVDTTFLQPLTATGVLVSDAGGAIARGTEITLFQDGLRQPGTASGIPLNTAADASFFGAEVPAGQIVLLESLGFSAYMGSAAPTDAAAQLLFQNVEVLMNLRGTVVENMGALVDWMDILGSSGAANNGRGQLGRSEWQIPMELEPQDPFSITLRVCRDLIGLGNDVPFFIRAHMRAPRIYDERVLALS